MSDVEKKSISNACAPVPGTPSTYNQNSRIWSPTQVGAGIAGRETRILASVLQRQQDENGNYLGETPHPVVGDVQGHPGVSALIRPLEWRVAVTEDQRTGLLYRKLPSPGGFQNSWLTSAESAVTALSEGWGRINSDRNAGVYRFEALHLAGRPQPTFPDLDELINELLAEYVIDRLDHPVLEKLFNPETQGNSGPRYDAPSTGFGEDADEIY